MKIVIIGSGIAAVEAAKTIRNADAESEITIYSRESVMPYRRPALTRMLSEELPDSQFLIHPAEFYTHHNIRINLNSEIVGLDINQQEIVVGGGETVVYDKLLIATGARCRMPDVPGNCLNEVVALREKSDLDILHRLLESGCRRICIVGGGLLGLEMADNLYRHGASVTVLEACPALLPRQIDAEGAALMLQAIEARSSALIRLGVTLARVNGTGRVEEVVTSAGETIPCDLVVVSVGIDCNFELGRDFGIAAKRGIVVNHRMETNVKNIYAAGDCTESDGRIFGTWNAARDQGAIAGANMAGESRCFEAGDYGARLVAFGVKLFSIGELSADCESKVVDKDEATMTYRRLFFRNGRIVGGILLGNVGLAVKLQKAVDEEWDVDKAMAAVGRPATQGD